MLDDTRLASELARIIVREAALIDWFLTRGRFPATCESIDIVTLALRDLRVIAARQPAVEKSVLSPAEEPSSAAHLP